MDNRNMQVARIFQVLSILQASRLGMTVKEIEDALTDRGFDVQKRTVYRDIDALETAGFPVIRDDGPPQRIRMEDQVRITNYLVLSPREILALYLAQGALLPLANTPFHSDLQGLFRKIDDKLGQSSRDHLNEIRDGFKFDPGPLWGLGMNPDVIEALRSATSERHILRGVYASTSSNTTRERRIGPHYLYFAKGSLYLVGEDLENHTVKVFSAPRFKTVEMTDEPYTGAITSPSDYFQDSFGVFNDNSPPVDVTIQFSRHIAAYVRERKWHSSQSIIDKPDGGIEMKLHCQVNLELVRWVLGFGANAQVTGPAALMESVRKESAKVQELYGAGISR